MILEAIENLVVSDDAPPIALPVKEEAKPQEDKKVSIKRV